MRKTVPRPFWLNCRLRWMSRFMTAGRAGEAGRQRSRLAAMLALGLTGINMAAARAVLPGDRATHKSRGSCHGAAAACAQRLSHGPAAGMLEPHARPPAQPGTAFGGGAAARHTCVSQPVYVGVQRAVQEVGVQQEHRGGEVRVSLCMQGRGQRGPAQQQRSDPAWARSQRGSGSPVA